MTLSLAQLGVQLQRGLAPVYVVAGEEPLLINESADAVRATARQQGFSERTVLDAGRDFQWGDLITLYATGSLFAERRIVEVRLAGGPGVEGGGVLSGLAARPNPDVLLLVVAGALDYRARQGGWFRALENAGAGVYVTAVLRDDLPGWIRQRARAQGLTLSDDAVSLLAERTEGNLLAAAQEILKLALLAGGAGVDVRSVEAAVADNARFGVFDWLDQVLSGEPVGAARALRRLREEGESVQALIGAFAYDLRQLEKAAQAGGGDVARAGAGLKVFPSRKPAYLRALSRLGPRDMGSALDGLARADRLSKRTGGEPAAWEELLVLGSKVGGHPRPGLKTS